MGAVFRAGDEPLATRLDHWHHVLAQALGPLDLRPPDDPDFRDELVVGALGAVHVAELTVTNPGVGHRTARHVRQGAHDLRMVTVQAEGRSLVEQAGHRSWREPGDLTFVDLSRPCRFVTGPARHVSVVFPRELLPLPDDQLAELAGTRLDGHEGLGALVSPLVRQLPRHLDEADEVTAARLGTAVLDVVGTALAARLDRPGAVPPSSRRRALRLEALAHIDEHLGDAALSPARVAEAIHVSVRYLHQLFEDEERTVADWIRHRRLERSRRALLDPANDHVPVSAIGSAVGLADPARFSRAFRRAYGLPPGEYRRRSRPPGAGLR